jgi:GLPGLI family protein
MQKDNKKINDRTLFFKTVLICTVFFSLEIFSQSGSIVYKNNATISNVFKEIKLKDSIEYKRYKDYAEYDKEINSNIEYELKFNGSKSTFTPIKNEDDKGMVAMRKNSEGVYYRDSIYNVHFINRRFKDYKVILIPIDWKIQDKSKKILNYNCRKAIGYKIRPKTKDTLGWKYEAWYTEDIKLQHGPIGAGGLPGIVLQLDYSGFHLYAESIELDQDIQIKKPKTKAKLIKEYKFDSIMKTTVN